MSTTQDVPQYHKENTTTQTPEASLQGTLCDYTPRYLHPFLRLLGGKRMPKCFVKKTPQTSPIQKYISSILLFYK